MATMQSVAEHAARFRRDGVEAGDHKLLNMIYVVDPTHRTVLLGHKARGFGAGNWNGFGGKVDPHDPHIRAAAVRELEEECGLRVREPAAMRRLAVNFYEYPAALQPRLFEVHVYAVLVHDVVGEVVESEEMNPIRMVPFDQVPFDKMWADDTHWLARWLDLVARGAEEACFVGYFRFRSYEALEDGDDAASVVWGTQAQLDAVARSDL